MQWSLTQITYKWQQMVYGCHGFIQMCFGQPKRYKGSKMVASFPGPLSPRTILAYDLLTQGFKGHTQILCTERRGTRLQFYIKMVVCRLLFNYVAGFVFLLVLCKHFQTHSSLSTVDLVPFCSFAKCVFRTEHKYIFTFDSPITPTVEGNLHSQ